MRLQSRSIPDSQVPAGPSVCVFVRPPLRELIPWVGQAPSRDMAVAIRLTATVLVLSRMHPGCGQVLCTPVLY